MTGHAFLQPLVDKLKETDPDKIILFGSYAYGNADRDSDIDLLVITNNDQIPKSFAEKSEIYLQISRTISDIKRQFPVDLIVHTRGMHNLFLKKNSSFTQELLTKGKVLYEKNDK